MSRKLHHKLSPWQLLALQEIIEKCDAPWDAQSLTALKKHILEADEITIIKSAPKKPVDSRVGIVEIALRDIREGRA